MGRYYEDFAVGDTYKHWPGRTITAVDNTWFTLLTMNQHPVHFDAEYAKHTEFGRPLVVRRSPGRMAPFAALART